MELSHRLRAIAEFVPKCTTLADIGTDHAYIPMFLLEKGIINYAIGTDISKGSVEKAINNAKKYRLGEKIDFRCGDGLEAVSVEDNIECIVISGMGGMLMIDVIKKNIPVVKGVERLIIQPQRDIDKVRKFIHSIGMRIVSEKILKEDGKFYNIIACENGGEAEYSAEEYLFGRLLLKENSPILWEYISYELNKINRVVDSISEMKDEHIVKRKGELTEKSNIYREVLSWLSK